MPDIAKIVLRDYGNELSEMKLNTVDITAANLAAQQAALATLVAAVPAITRGVVAESLLQIETPGSAILPTDMEAQVEKGWLITYVDTQAFLDPPTDTVPNPGFGQPFTLTWPTAQYTGHLSTNSDFADLANVQVAAFVTAFNALYISPYGGTVAVQTIRVSGSNS